MGKEQFIGTWKFVSSEFRRPDGQLTNPVDKDRIGIIIYDASGHMSMQMMKPNRPAFASGDRLKGTPAEIKSAFEGFSAFFGTYEVNDEEGILITHVEGGLFPNQVGSSVKRLFEFSDNRLTLRTPPMPMDGEQVTGVLVWERAE